MLERGLSPSHKQMPAMLVSSLLQSPKNAIPLLAKEDSGDGSEKSEASSGEGRESSESPHAERSPQVQGVATIMEDAKVLTTTVAPDGVGVEEHGLTDFWLKKHTISKEDATLKREPSEERSG